MTDIKHRVPIQTRFGDADSLQHINNAVYQSYFDLGRVAYFQQVLGFQVNESSETLVLVHLEVDYKVQTRLHHRIEVRSQVTGIGNRSVKMRQQIVNIETGVVHVDSFSVLSGLSRATNTSVPVRPEWRKAIEEYEGERLQRKI